MEQKNTAWGGLQSRTAKPKLASKINRHFIRLCDDIWCISGLALI